MYNIVSDTVIRWDPRPEALFIPYFHIPLRWYGICFSLGLILAALQFLPSLREKLRKSDSSPEEVNRRAHQYLDGLIWFSLIGMIVGARLGHVVFYDWAYYREHLGEIPKIWQGGLASHGGTVGLLLSVFIYARRMRASFPEISFVNLCDLLAVPASLAAMCIRIGNFFNQEIVGIPTSVPWGVAFGHPADHLPPVPRHPVQLYEASAYLLTGIILSIWYRRTEGRIRPGRMFGAMLLFIFGSRFFLEFVKMPMTSMLNDASLQMGQLLSLPFIAAGALLFFANGTKYQRQEIG